MQIILLFVAFLFACCHCKDWSKVNFDKLEEDWKDGDESEELETEYDSAKRVEERINKARKPLNFDLNDPESLARISKQGGGGSSGGTMVFINLLPEDLSGESWTTEKQEQLASKWATMLKHGSIAAHVYNVDDKQMLMSTTKAWMMPDMLNFITLQPEVDSYTLDSKTTNVKKIRDDEDL